jgi:hypothetical protein
MAALRPRAAIAAALLYAATGVTVAELVFQGFLHAERLADFALEIAVTFVIVLVFLEPLSDRVQSMLRLRAGERPPALTLGRAAAAGLVALLLVFLHIAVGKAIEPDPGAAVRLFALLAAPVALVTLAWLLGWPQRRSALYGAAAGALTEIAARMGLWAATGSVLGVAGGPPDALSTAVIAALAGGLRGALLGACGGFALDRTGGGRALRNLALGLAAAVVLWSAGYVLLGGRFGLPGATPLTQLLVGGVTLLDYAGWMLGLAFCPLLPAAFARRGVAAPEPTAEPEILA